MRRNMKVGRHAKGRKTEKRHRAEASAKVDFVVSEPSLDTGSLAAMRELRSDSPGDHAQERLRLHKDEVKAMEARVQGFVRDR